MRKKWIIALLIPLVLIVVAGLAGYWVVFGPNTKLYTGKRSVYIPRGAGFEEVTDSLMASDVLASRATFEWFGKLTGWASQVKAGHYTFEAGASNHRILDVIRKGLQSPVKLTVPPGTRPEVIAAVAGRDMEFEPEAFLEALQDTSLARELGTSVDHLFAFMMPETYHFYWLNDARTVVKKVKESFDAFYSREIAARADSLGLTKNEVLILASIVEWETSIDAEKPRVAGVYLNRLRKNWPLQADPTVQYAVIAKEGRKRRLLYQDYEIQHPYNTYKIAGLPPGPITNPSPSSIRAVANVEKHDYMYFVARGDGSHTFSRTLAEHNRAAQEYYRLMRERRLQQAK